MNRIGICAIATFLAMDPVLTVRADGLPVKPGQNVPFCVHYYDMVPYLNTIIVLRVCFGIHGWAFLRTRLPPMATRIMACETSIRFS